jgi:alkylhydroperoxidase family enzyme
VAALLERMMPPGVPPIALFRLFAHNEPMTDAMHGWGSYDLSRRLPVTLRTRELVIDRVTARLGCEYEWGVHVAVYAERAGFTSEQVRSLAYGLPADPCWDDDDRVALRLVDALIDTAECDDHLWADIAKRFSAAQLLDLILLAWLVPRGRLRGQCRPRSPRRERTAVRRLQARAGADDVRRPSVRVAMTL